MASNNIVTYSPLEPSNIDLSNYSDSLVAEALRTGRISEEDVLKLQSNTVEALAEVIGYYTKNESSSIKNDTARALSKSLLYNTDTYLRSLGNHDEALSCLLEKKVGELYGKGYLINKNYYDEARRLYARVRFTRLKDGDEEYNKTLDKYFKYYLTNYSPKFSSDLKIYLNMKNYGISGSYHIDESISVLKRILQINEGTKSNIILDNYQDSTSS